MRLGALALAVFAAACGDDTCVPAPCPQGLAMQVYVRAFGSTAAVQGATVRPSPGSDNVTTCLGSPAMCQIFGGSGTYTIEVRAPGFQTVTRAVVVPAADVPGCGCARPATQAVDVQLTPDAAT